MTVKYLQTDKKSGLLSYRRKFLKELRRFIPSSSRTGKGRVELKESLRVRSMNEPKAMDRYRTAASEYERLVNDAERLKAAEAKRLSGTHDGLDARTIAYLASLVISEGLWIDEDVRLFTEPSERKRQRAAGMREVCAADLAECRELRGVGDIDGIVRIWGDEAASLAETEGLYVDRTSQSFAALCNAINDGQITVWEGVLARLDGNLVPTPPPPTERQRPEGPSALSERISLLELYERYASGEGRHPKTIAQWRPYVADLASFVPTDNALTIAHEDLVAWRNHLRDGKTYRGKRLSAKTINGSYLAAINAMFSWARGDGIIARNPMLEVTPVRLPAKTTTRSKAFTTGEATAILQASFNPSTSREGEHLRNAKRWCPWLMAYSGARVNEVTQLRKEDVFEEDGIIVMRLTPDAGTIKSGVYRLVPLHRHILEQGFLQFVAGKPEGPLFFDPAKRRSDHAINRQSNRLGSKLAEWVRSLGIEGVKPNHAWRHLFISQAPRFQMDPRTTKAITGHSSSDVHDKDYLHEYVDVKAREIAKMPRFLEV